MPNFCTSLSESTYGVPDMGAEGAESSSRDDLLPLAPIARDLYFANTSSPTCSPAGSGVRRLDATFALRSSASADSSEPGVPSRWEVGSEGWLASSSSCSEAVRSLMSTYFIMGSLWSSGPLEGSSSPKILICCNCYVSFLKFSLTGPAAFPSSRPS